MGREGASAHTRQFEPQNWVGAPGAVEREDKGSEDKILGNTNAGKANRERTYKGEGERGK